VHAYYNENDPKAVRIRKPLTAEQRERQLDYFRRYSKSRRQDPGYRAKRNAQNADRRRARLREDPAYLETIRAYNWGPAGQRPEPTRPRPSACELCGRLPDKTALHMDHDHKTGKFRGWLCGWCNRALGLLRDDPILLRKAADYVT
jgi:hypothetical protein